MSTENNITPDQEQANQQPAIEQPQAGSTQPDTVSEEEHMAALLAEFKGAAYEEPVQVQPTTTTNQSEIVEETNENVSENPETETDVKVDDATIEPSDSATNEGGIIDEQELSFIEQLAQDPEKIKELYLSQQDLKNKVSEYDKKGASKVLRMVGDLKMDQLALAKEALNGNKEAMAALVKAANIDPVDLVAEDLSGEYDVSEKLKALEETETAIPIEEIKRKMFDIATVDGADENLVKNILGKFDDQSLIDIASDPDNSKKFLGSLERVDEALAIFERDSRFDFNGSMANFDSFDKLSYGLKALEALDKESVTDSPEETKTNVQDKITKQEKIVEQQNAFSAKKDTSTTASTSGGSDLDSLLNEFKEVNGLR